MPAHNRRFKRQLKRFERRLPFVGGVLTALAQPGRIWLRIPVAWALILGGMLGFLPILGFWMLPLGAILLALDIKRLRPVVGVLIVRVRVEMRRWRRRR